jgi:hypothetical protein
MLFAQHNGQQSGHMNGRYFTLDEARAILPEVMNLMEQVQEARREILRLRPDVWPALRNAASNGGNAQAGEMLEHFYKLEAGVKGIMNLGVLVKDIDSGLLDFLSIRRGREVFLCWQYGEDQLRFWHELNAGYVGRKPINDDDFR